MARPRKATRKAAAFDQPLTREIRQAIAEDGRNLNALAVDAGVDQAAVRRFMSRERSLSLESADRLAVALGLSLVRKSRPRKAGPSQTPSAHATSQPEPEPDDVRGEGAAEAEPTVQLREECHLAEPEAPEPPAGNKFLSTLLSDRIGAVERA